MTEVGASTTWEKAIAQREYAKSLIQSEDVRLEEGLKNASEQFDRLVPMVWKLRINFSLKHSMKNLGNQSATFGWVLKIDSVEK